MGKKKEKRAESVTVAHSDCILGAGGVLVVAWIEYLDEEHL